MFSLSISFGPTGMVWAFLFKEEKNAKECELNAKNLWADQDGFNIVDDFGQNAAFKSKDVHAILLENLDLIEAARIQRSLADERCKAKFLQAARSDSTIRAGMGNQMPIMQPMGGFPRN
jgi:hypothetical protein